MFDYIILDAETRMPVDSRNITLKVIDTDDTYSLEDTWGHGELQSGSPFPEIMKDVTAKVGIFFLSPWNQIAFWGKFDDGEWHHYMVARQGKYIIQFHINDRIEEVRY